ncbi:choice-of-anchor L domain-containing protein [Crocinitomicaceae bacterium]|nr:choice-of-anchor L domain-containing protein [Crocinitomicaceae bacterium]
MMGNLKHIIILAFLSLGFLSSQDCYGQLVITNQGGTAQDIVDAMVGFGLDVSNATISCPSDSYGTFTNGETTCANIPSGVLLSTGNLNNIGLPAGTQDFSPNFSEQMDGNGPFGTSCNDPELLSLEPLAQYDCCILEFDVVPTCNTLLIRFVFGSEEYPEYVNSSFNDAFGFFVSGTNPVGANYNNTNVATLPDNVTIVSVDNVSPFTNPAFYINNAGCTNIALDGLTTVLTREIEVIPCESYHFKLAIADAGDPIYDSGVFIDFLECVNAIEPILSSTPSGCLGNDGTATVDLSGGFPPYTIEWNTIPVQNGPTATGLAPGTYEVTVDDAGACTSPITQTVVVSSSVNNVTPTFTQEGPFCEGVVISDLPQSSNEGITGSWSPAIDNTQTTTYTFTPDAGQCADVVTMDITIDPSQVPTFTQQGPYCEGDAIPNLNTTSNEGITGSWSPAIDNTQTVTYTFAPDVGQCSNTQTMEIAIDPLVTPTFTQQGPYCEGDVITNISTTSNEGISGSWSPAIDNSQTTNYTFTPDVGQCSNTQTMEITIDPLVTPTFTQQGPYCEGDAVPNISTTSNEGISGSWSPAIDNSQTTNYTFTPDLGQCSNTQTMEITIDPLVTPSFDQVGPYCEGSNPPALTTNSLEGIDGVWGPPGINTTIIGPSTFAFVPNTGQCATNQTMEIIITALQNPSFNQIVPYCEGSVISDLNTISIEGVTGNWSPSIDNTQTTTYTFTPDAGQCSDIQTMEIVIDLLETPTFVQQPPICVGDNFSLSNVSNEGITGSWSPTIDNTQTTPYTFIPDAGQCSNEQTMEVSVGPPETPTFAIMGPYCQTGNIDDLPLTSLEGFTGTWNPNTVDNTSTGVFTSTFTPDVGLCATLASIDITITDAPSITAAALDSTLCEGESAVLFAMDITGGQLVETFTMDVTAPFNYTTSNTNAVGSYYVIVSGTIMAMSGEERDANYQFIFNNNPVNPPVPGTFWQWNGSSAASQSTVPFVYNPAHIYNYFFSGGAPQTFTFSDSGPYIDNSGSLVFEIYYMGDLLWSTGATEIGDTIVPPSGNNIYTVSIDFGNGCVASDEVDVLVNSLDSPTFEPIPPICVGGDIILPIISNEGYTGTWSPAIDNTQTTEYTFTPDAGQCASEQFVSVEVGPPSTPTFDVIPPICSGIDVSLPSESLEGFTGTWSPVINNLETTTYTFTPDANQCALVTDLTIEVLENPIISTGDPLIACIGDIVTLLGSGAGSGGTYSWDNGVVDGVSFTVSETLLYTVTGTDENGCIGTASIMVTGLPVPIAGISASPESGGVPLEVIFTNTSQNATNYQWDFGNDEFNTVNNQSAQNSTYLDFGSYTVWLIADNGVCDDSISIVISTTVEPQIFVPNVFTPNSDGSNETFMISTENMQSIELLIVNRWGNLMATIDDLNGGWDGITPGGRDAKEGVYFYRYSATGLDGSEWVGHGFFSLVR